MNFDFTIGGDNKGQTVAAATYLKNYIRKNIDASKVSKEFRDAFMRALLQVEPAVLKVLVEGVCVFGIMFVPCALIVLFTRVVLYSHLDVVSGNCCC